MRLRLPELLATLVGGGVTVTVLVCPPAVRVLTVGVWVVEVLSTVAVLLSVD